MIIVECPQCNTALRVPERYAGQVGMCKKCGGKLHVPVSIGEEEENWIFQPPAPILPTDKPSLVPLPSIPPVAAPVVSPPVLQPLPFDGEFEEPVSYRRISPRLQQKDDVDKRFILGLVGSISLCIGVFAPLVSAPIVGAQNYFANGQGEGAIVLLIGIASFFAVFLKKYEALWITGVGSFAMVIRAFLQFHNEMGKARAEMQADMGSNPFFAGAADAMIDTVQIEWGWAVLLVGSILLIASASIVDVKQSNGLRFRYRGKSGANS